MIEAFFNFHGI